MSKATLFDSRIKNTLTVSRQKSAGILVHLPLDYPKNKWIQCGKDMVKTVFRNVKQIPPSSDCGERLLIHFM